MIGNSLLTQVIVAAVAIGIVVTYIQPKFGEIKQRQDEIAQTQEELERVTAVNNQLKNLYDRVNGISQQDKAALLIYLPDQIDEVQILKDLTAMARDAGVDLRDVRYQGDGAANGVAEDYRSPHSFALSFESSYEDMKKILSNLERNNYPLVIEQMSVRPTEGGFLSVDIGLMTYSLNETEGN